MATKIKPIDQQTLATYQAAYANASQMMSDSDGLEPTSALKQAASDLGIAYGEPMGEFVRWAHKRINATV